MTHRRRPSRFPPPSGRAPRNHPLSDEAPAMPHGNPRHLTIMAHVMRRQEQIGKQEERAKSPCYFVKG